LQQLALSSVALNAKYYDYTCYKQQKMSIERQASKNKENKSLSMLEQVDTLFLFTKIILVGLLFIPRIHF
jgi:hypothetical protein